MSVAAIAPPAVPPAAPSVAPSAYSIYPDRYPFVLRDETLKKIGTGYKTHSSLSAEKLHWVINNIILIPFKLCQRGYAHMTMPCPGENKEWPLWEQDAIRIGALFLFFITIPLAIASLVIGMPLRVLEHQYRPVIQYYKSAVQQLPPALAPLALAPASLPKLRGFHFRTVNLSLTPSCWVNVSNDLRDPIDRAKELANSIIGEGDAAPDVIMVQEAWNEDASKEFCTLLSKRYPHILHSICPQIGGMDSGYLVLSKHPPLYVEFERFEHMTWQHSMPPRGILSVHFATDEGRLILYNLHTQSLWGPERTAVRKEQFKQLKNKVEKDYLVWEEFRLHQFIMGDLNTSRIREDGTEDADEAKNVDQLEHDFENTFWRDHHYIVLRDQRRSIARKTSPTFLAADNARMKRNLLYPEGTFVYGCCPEKEIPDNPHGTHRALKEQKMAPGCILDYILNRKNAPFTAHTEIRRPVILEGQSVSTDHAFLDGVIFNRQEEALGRAVDRKDHKE